MIKTKAPILIDSRTKKEAVIYLDCPVFNWDEIQQLVSYLVVIFTKENDVFTEIERIPAVYKMSDFIAIVGEFKFSEYEAKKNELMINQISENSAKYWDLKSNDLEII